jgi:hypothetical protein
MAMNITIGISKATEQKLKAQAVLSGQSLAAYVEDLAERVVAENAAGAVRTHAAFLNGRAPDDEGLMMLIQPGEQVTPISKPGRSPPAPRRGG